MTWPTPVARLAALFGCRSRPVAGCRLLGGVPGSCTSRTCRARLVYAAAGYRADSSDRISAFRGTRVRELRLVTRLAETFATALGACNDTEQHHRQALVIRGEHQQREVVLRDAERFPPLGVNRADDGCPARDPMSSWRYESNQAAGPSSLSAAVPLADATGRGGSSASEPKPSERRKAAVVVRNDGRPGPPKRTSSSINARASSVSITPLLSVSRMWLISARVIGLLVGDDRQDLERRQRQRFWRGLVHARAPQSADGLPGRRLRNEQRRLRACILRLAGVRSRCILRCTAQGFVDRTRRQSSAKVPDSVSARRGCAGLIAYKPSSPSPG